ncbi:type IX secretion system membrane protein PorP/SprF [Tenacibaculum finnmarkense]|uniref:PorP/SprF family type IX secretion system membrane protein n=1 Tax=Tenacibaculum finnmarkense TaxID=2781243 RepID=UPI001EFB49C5|nr:type IX secretion system membrane protein PorP/SprF [Tenacibaculum finnmarkense]MCG8861474.1 type IX secretion system membrane protein PorP/SprF [Tenacibaculum finnmarkense]
MMLLKKLTFVLLITLAYTGIAQNNVDYSLYNYSLNLVNPAFAGQKNNTELLISSRKQWSGIPDAPKTSSFSLNIPLKGAVGLGLSVVNDKIFVFNQTVVALDFSYKLKMSRDHDLLFGIKAKGNMYSGSIDKIRTAQSNDALFSVPINKFNPNFSIGAAIVHEDYYTHLYIDNLLTDNRYELKRKSKNKNHYNVNIGGGYTLELNEILKLTPSVLVRFIEGAPLSFDVNTVLNIKEFYNVGMSYSWNNAVQLNSLISATKWFDIGYGYNLYLNDLSTYQNGTHEILLRFNVDEIL